MIDMVKISQREDGCFLVKHNDMESCPMSWDEMMGLVATITMPYTRPCMQWLKKNMWSDAPHGRVRIKREDGEIYESKGLLAQASNGSWAFRSDDGTICPNLDLNDVEFTKDDEKDET